MPCRALPYAAKLCDVVRLCAVLYLLFRTCQVSFDEVSYRRTAALAQKSSAVWCRALPCDVVLCGAARYLLFRRRQVSFDEVVSYSSTEVCHTRSVGTTLLNHKKCTPSSAQLSYSSAARSAAPYGAVRCRALRCGAVPCCAGLSFENTVPGIMRSTRYRYVRVHSSFLLFSVIVLPLGPLDVSPPRKLHPYCGSERDIANKHTAQHRATSSAQVALGIIKSLVAPNHGPLRSAPFTFSCNPPRASVAGAVSRPRSGVLVHSYSHRTCAICWLYCYQYQVLELLLNGLFLGHIHVFLQHPSVFSRASGCGHAGGPSEFTTHVWFFFRDCELPRRAAQEIEKPTK